MRNTSLFIVIKQSIINVYHLLCGQISFCNLFRVVGICAFIFVGQVIATEELLFVPPTASNPATLVGQTDFDVQTEPTTLNPKDLLELGIPSRNQMSHIRFPPSTWHQVCSYFKKRFSVPLGNGYKRNAALCGWTKKVHLTCGTAKLPVTSWIPKSASFSFWDLFKQEPLLWGGMGSKKMRGHHQKYLYDGTRREVPPRRAICIAQPTNSLEGVSDHVLFCEALSCMSRKKIDFHFVVDCNGRITMPLPPYMTEPVYVSDEKSISLVSKKNMKERTKARSVGPMNTFLLCSIMCVTRSNHDGRNFTGKNISLAQMMAIAQIYLFLQEGNPWLDLELVKYSELTPINYGCDIPRQDDMSAIRRAIEEAKSRHTSTSAIPETKTARPLHYHYNNRMMEPG